MKICLHYDRRRKDGNQPRGSFLYARLIKCLTAPVDGITDCCTKSCGVGLQRVWKRERVCSVWSGQLDFRGLTALGLWRVCGTSPPHTRAAYQLSQSITQDGWRKCREKRSGADKKNKIKKWREERKEEEKRERGRAGQGLSVEKTAMKGNCHAPVLAQEHLSPEEHTKCAGHVLTIPPHFSTHTLTHTSWEERADAPPLERHRLSDSMPLKLSLAHSHMQEKVRLMKKKQNTEAQWRNHWDMNRPPQHRKVCKENPPQ